MASHNETYEIYTDGSEKNNKGKWAYIAFLNGEIVRTTRASVNNTTSNQMELMAVIQAIQFFKGKRMRIYTDSQYVQRGYNEFLSRWCSNNWKGTRGTILNVNLWKQLNALKDINIQVIWIERNSAEGNKIADSLTK